MDRFELWPNPDHPKNPRHCKGRWRVWTPPPPPVTVAGAGLWWGAMGSAGDGEAQTPTRATKSVRSAISNTGGTGFKFDRCEIGPGQHVHSVYEPGTATTDKTRVNVSEHSVYM